MKEFPVTAPSVVARTFNYASGERQQAHQHERVQLMYSPCGIMRVTMADCAWTLAPMRALWIPVGAVHSVRMVGTVSMQSVYIDAAVLPIVSEDSFMLPVTPLMRELILKLNLPHQQFGPAQVLASQLLLHLLADAPRQQTALPMPHDRRLRKVCDAVLVEPGNDDPLEVWGERMGASARTLARRMKAETGLTFHHWRLLVRIDEAICRLSEGATVAAVARYLGYQSTSAFVYMFRSVMGLSPAQYLAQTVTGVALAA